jgi:CelD/BcsL family acetyltransferase involved in cellulose biosynthesis
MGNMRLQVSAHWGSQGLQDLERDWSHLYARIRKRRHLHQIEWYVALAQTFEHAQSGNLVCLRVSHSSRPILIMPLQAVRVSEGRSQLKMLELLSDPTGHQSARDFLIDEAFEDTTLLADFLHYLAKIDGSWDIISLRGILADSCAFSSMKKARKINATRFPGGHWGKNEFVTCAPGHDPFLRLSKSFRQNLRTAHNKLKGRDVSYTSVNRCLDVQEMFSDFLNVESSGWKGEGGSSVLKIPSLQYFLNNLAKLLAASNGCEIHVMKVDGKVAAALFCVVADGISYLLRTGYDEALHLASPGNLLFEHLLKTKGAAGNTLIVAPYNAPPWFKAWRPDVILGIYNVIIRRPDIEGSEPGQQRGFMQSVSAYFRSRLRLSKTKPDVPKKFRFAMQGKHWRPLIPYDIDALPYTATNLNEFPVHIDDRILSVGIYENGWVGEMTHFDFDIDAIDQPIWLHIEGYVPPDARFLDQELSWNVGDETLAHEFVGETFFSKIQLRLPAERLEMRFGKASAWAAADGRTISCKVHRVWLEAGSGTSDANGTRCPEEVTS